MPRMTKVNFPNRRSIATPASTQGRWLMAIAAGIVCCALLAVSHGADQVDSGWSIGLPSPFATAPKTCDPHQQYILRSVLDQTQHPLLQKPSPSVLGPESEDNAAGQERIAARPEGWRKAGEST